MISLDGFVIKAVYSIEAHYKTLLKTREPAFVK